MKKLLLTGTAAAATLGFGAALAQAPTPAPIAAQGHMRGHAQLRAEVPAHVQAMFARLDADRNGWLTKAEAESGKDQWREAAGKRRERRADHSFEQLDSNRDNSISRAEFDAAHAQHSDRMANHGAGPGDRMKRRGMGGMHMFGGRMFEMSDADKNGQVSLQEATNAALQHFDSADSNRDGQLTREERTNRRDRVRGERRRG